ncbi:hypothetical protein IAR50_002820 [Cryptococcus sp. DSM 104548]
MSHSPSWEALTYLSIEDARSNTGSGGGSSTPNSLDDSLHLPVAPAGQTMSGIGTPASHRSPSLRPLNPRYRPHTDDDPTWTMTADDTENDADVESINTTYSQLPGTLALPIPQVKFPDGNTPRQLTMFDRSKDRDFVVPRPPPSEDDPIEYQVILSIDEWHEIYALWDNLAFPKSRINDEGQEVEDGFARLRVIFSKEEKDAHLNQHLDVFMSEIRMMLSSLAGNKGEDDSESTDDASILCDNVKLYQWFRYLYDKAYAQAAPGESLNPMRISLHVGWNKKQTVEGFAAMEERERKRQKRLGLPIGRLGNELDEVAVRMARENVLEEERKEKEAKEKANKQDDAADDCPE